MWARGSSGSGQDWQPAEEFYLVPRSSAPTLALPAGRRAAAAAAVLRYKTPASARDAWRMRATSIAVRAGVAARLLGWQRLGVGESSNPQGSLTEHLGAVLGQDLVPCVHVGPPRANRKPIVQLVSPAGQSVAFAKIGVNALTAALVRAESRALQQVAAAGPAGLEVPRVLHHGQWNGLEILVLSALPPADRRRPTAQQTLEAMREVSRCADVEHRSLAESTYWSRLQAEIGATGALSGRLAGTAQLLARCAGATDLEFGCWHGDWAPWNMAAHSGSVMLWDWERFERDVPVGYDPLHFDLQSMIRLQGRAPRAAAAALADSAADRLGPCGVPGQAARVVAALYLMHVAVRNARDDQDGAGSRRGPVEGWLVPVLEAQVDALARRADRT